MPIKTTFGERFKHLIECKNISYAEFGRQFGCDRSQVTRWKKAKEIKQEGSIIRLVNYFKCSREWLETGAGNPYTESDHRHGYPIIDTSKTQIAKNGSKINNSGGDMVHTSNGRGAQDVLQLSTLERAAIEMNRENGSDAQLIDFMSRLQSGND